jgi:hypothetical protein
MSATLLAPALLGQPLIARFELLAQRIRTSQRPTTTSTPQRNAQVVKLRVTMGDEDEVQRMA